MDSRFLARGCGRLSQTELALITSADKPEEISSSPDIAEPKMRRLIGDPEHAEDKDVLAAEPQRHAADRGGAKYTTPASRNRVVSRISGGQSAMASFATEKAEAQSRQTGRNRLLVLESGR